MGSIPAGRWAPFLLYLSDSGVSFFMPLEEVLQYWFLLNKKWMPTSVAWGKTSILCTDLAKKTLCSMGSLKNRSYFYFPRLNFFFCLVSAPINHRPMRWNELCLPIWVSLLQQLMGFVIIWHPAFVRDNSKSRNEISRSGFLVPAAFPLKREKVVCCPLLSFLTWTGCLQALKMHLHWKKSNLKMWLFLLFGQ